MRYLFAFIVILGLNVNIKGQSLSFKKGEKFAFEESIKWMTDSVNFENFKKSIKNIDLGAFTVSQYYTKNLFRTKLVVFPTGELWTLNFLIYKNNVVRLDMRCYSNDSLAFCDTLVNRKRQALISKFTYYPPTFHYKDHKFFYVYTDSNLIDKVHHEMKLGQIGFPDFVNYDSVLQEDLRIVASPITNYFIGTCSDYADSVLFQRHKRIFESRDKKLLFSLLNIPNEMLRYATIKGMLYYVKSGEIVLTKDEKNHLLSIINDKNRVIYHCEECENSYAPFYYLFSDQEMNLLEE